MSTAFAVVDLGFGDAGKGLLTDYLVREHAARLVVRFNGGAQAGHNVVLADGRHHTFAQLGAGSFVPGVRTHLARDVIVHPAALLFEAEALARVGVPAALTRLSVDPECLVTTPFQQAAGRLRELARGEARHGSCGVGVGETVSDALTRPELSVRFAELRAPARIRERLRTLQAEKLAEFTELLEGNQCPEAHAELAALTDPALVDRFLAVASPIARQVELVADEGVLALANGSPIVCEGAQGVLLTNATAFIPSPRGAAPRSTARVRCWHARALAARSSASACTARTPCGTVQAPCRPRMRACRAQRVSRTITTDPGSAGCAKGGSISCCSSMRCAPVAASTP